MKKLITILLSLHASLFTVHQAGAQGCLPEGITFSFQSQIDSFAINYPNCTEIEGDVVIGCGWEGTTDISNLEGLYVLESIGGNLTIGSWSTVFPYYLTSLSGLDNVNSIGGWLEISGSVNLTNLNGLESLNSIGGRLVIWVNSNLTTLSGIDHINGGSILELYISENPFLSSCEVASVCAYLANPNGTIAIENNATGCNSQEEVEAVCAVGIQSAVGGRQSAVSCYPNPTTGNVSFQWTANNGQWTMNNGQ